MCGILGACLTTPLSPSRWEAFMGGLNGMANRGPDDWGWELFSAMREDNFASRVFQGNNHRHPEWAEQADIWLGHRRLSIIDLSRAGHQPISFDKNRFWIVYNGEVYNYLELRDELRRLGYEFHTGTDTEVILTAYKEWGESCFDRFNGMWAMAILDRHSKSLLLSRDRSGVKPM